MAIYREKNSIGEYLRIQLTKKGVSITQFASDLGLSRGLVQKYVSNDKHPTDATLERIADYFDLPVSYFKGESFFDINEMIRNVPEKLDQENIASDIMDQYKKQMSWINAYFEYLEEEDKKEFLIRLNSLIQDEKTILVNKKLTVELEEPVSRETVENWNLTRYLIQLEDVSFEWICKIVESISNNHYDLAIRTINDLPAVLNTRDPFTYVPVHPASEEGEINLKNRNESITKIFDSLTGLQTQIFESLGYIIVNLAKDEQKILNSYISQLLMILNNKRD